jgi:hypothetical protein
MTVQFTQFGKDQLVRCIAFLGSTDVTPNQIIQQMHRDHVRRFPPNAHMLGSTDLTPNQVMVILDPAPAIDSCTHRPRLPRVEPPITSMIIDARAGIFGEALANNGRSRAAGIPGDITLMDCPATA